MNIPNTELVIKLSLESSMGILFQKEEDGKYVFIDEDIIFGTYNIRDAAFFALGLMARHNVYIQPPNLPTPIMKDAEKVYANFENLLLEVLK